jgi:glyoxylase-like metal-dependent hydrolase (beta-lactamase superfamily II)
MTSSKPAESFGNAHSAPLSSLTIGSVTVTYLPDGIHRVEAPSHYPDSPDRIWGRHPEVIDAEGLLVMSVGSVLIRTPRHNVLVDIGFGPQAIDISELTDGRFRGDLIGGRLLDSLRSVGLSPDDIHGIVFTHLHVDHVGWVQDPDDPAAPTFRNARYFMHAKELDYWLNEKDPLERGKGASDEQISVMQRAVTTVDGQTEIFPGITLVPTTGHTPGHTSVLAESGGERVLVLGDALHCPVELQHNGMVFVHDQDVADAKRSRARIHEILAVPGTYFAGGHFPNRTFGKVVPGDGTLDHCLEYPAS